ncbi:hypothetical protein E2320_007368 [Naja naja]|nr:hypothetical protein E2320_007368 [Naja naja]
MQLLEDYKQGSLPPGTTNQEVIGGKEPPASPEGETWARCGDNQRLALESTENKTGYIPFGTPIWLNQSHNACVNYANRNATKVGLNVLIQRANQFTPATRILIQRFVPFPAVASANICNVVLMRHTELEEGIDVLDGEGNVVGSSRIAARHEGKRHIWSPIVSPQALLETALTRVVLPMPILVLPPIIMSLLEKTAFLRSRPRMLLPVQSLVCLAAFGLALPLAISLFPQMSEIETARLEPEIAQATTSLTVTYNKGL